jgi:hypothetical protein
MRSRLALLALVVIGCGSDPAPARWEILQEVYAASFLGVWGSSERDVWIVGGDARDTGGDGLGPVVLQYDGTTWKRHDTGLRRIDLWWVFGFQGGPIFLGGSNGTVLRYQDGVFTTLPTPSTGIVFGIWGSSPTDLWFVGGQFAANGFAWHFDGTTFTPATLPSDLTTSAVWKVAGTSANNVWMSASLGAVLHWDGQSLTRENVGNVDENLFSIGVRSNLVVAVGGNITNGQIYERVGTTWTKQTFQSSNPPWRGVAVTEDAVYAVGQEAHVAQRGSSGWTEDVAEDAFDSFHAAWIDPKNALWAVGGKFDRIPPIDGIIAYKGTSSITPVGL